MNNYTSNSFACGIAITTPAPIPHIFGRGQQLVTEHWAPECATVDSRKIEIMPSGEVFVEDKLHTTLPPGSAWCNAPAPLGGWSAHVARIKGKGK